MDLDPADSSINALAEKIPSFAAGSVSNHEGCSAPDGADQLFDFDAAAGDGMQATDDREEAPRPHKSQSPANTTSHPSVGPDGPTANGASEISSTRTGADIANPVIIQNRTVDVKLTPRGTGSKVDPIDLDVKEQSTIARDKPATSHARDTTSTSNSMGATDCITPKDMPPLGSSPHHPIWINDHSQAYEQDSMASDGKSDLDDLDMTYVRKESHLDYDTAVASIEGDLGTRSKGNKGGHGIKRKRLLRSAESRANKARKTTK